MSTVVCKHLSNWVEHPSATCSESGFYVHVCSWTLEQLSWSSHGYM